jgi:hypothetical protein
MMIVATTLLALTLIAPGHPSITTRVSARPHLTVGDRFDMTLVVTSPSPSLVTGPLADSMGMFAVGDEKRTTARRSGSAETTYRLSVAGFKPGTHRLPVFTFLVLTGPKTDTLRSDTGSVTIASLLPGTMKDINGLKPAETFPNYWLWAVPGLVLLLGALAWIGRRLYRRFERSRALALAPLPPWEEALRVLDAMPWREWLEAGQFKRYYYALSEVLKRYIERRFEFQAAEQTTTEMLAAMRLHKTPMRDDVAKFFTRSDLVKYSKVVPPQDEAQFAIDQVREFVMRTMPQEPAAATGTGGGAAADSVGGA